MPQTNTSQRTAPIHVRMTRAEHNVVEAKARQAGYSISEYVRRFILEWDGPTGVHEDMAAMREQIEWLVGQVEALNEMANR